MPSVERPIIQGQFDSLVTDCGFATNVNRPDKSTNAQGQVDETPNEIVTGEIMWIQPARGNSQVIQGNLNDRTTHLMFQRIQDTGLEANDKVTQTAGPLTGKEFDVINHFIFDSHRLSELALVEKA